MKKKILIGLAVFFVVAVLALAFVVPRLVDVERYRPEIERAASEALRKKVSIGSLELKILPFVAVRAGDIAVFDDPDDPLLAVEAADVSPRILPLLRKKVEIRSVTLVKPRIVLRFDKNGNLILLSELAHLTEKKEGEAKGGGAAEDFSLGTLRVKDGTLVLRKPNGFGGLPSKIGMEAFDLRLDNVGMNRAMRAEMSAKVMPFGFTITFSGNVEPTDFSDLDALAYRAKVGVEGLDLAGFAKIFESHGIPVTGGTLALRGEAWSKGDGAVHADVEASVAKLTPQNTDAAVAFRGAWSPKVISVEKVSLDVKPFEISTLAQLWKKWDMPPAEGTLGLSVAAERKKDGLAAKGNVKASFREPRALDLDAAFDGTWRDDKRLALRALDIKTKAANISVSGEASPLDGQAPLDLSVTLRDTRLEEIAALSELGLMGGADFSSMQGRAEADVRATGTIKEPRFEGKASLSDFSLKTDYFTVPIRAPKIEAQFKGKNFTFDPIYLALDKTTLEGRMTLSDFDAPKVDFAFRSPEIDVGGLMALMPPEDPAAAKAKKPSQAASEDDVLVKMRLKGTLETPKALYSGMTLEDMKAGVRMERGVFHVDPLTFGIYGGKARQTFSVNLASAQQPFALAATLEGVDVKRMVEAGTEHKDLVRGRLFLDLDLTGEGLEAEGMGKRLKGKGRFEIKDGAVTSFDLTKLLQQVGGVLGIKRGIDEGTTAFERLDGDFTIGHAVFSTENTHLASPDLDSRVRGSLDFDGNLDVYASTYLSREISDQIKGSTAKSFFTAEDGRVVMPAHIKGTIYDPKVTLDMEYIKKQLEKQIKKKVEEKLKEGIKKKLLEGLKW